MRKILLYFIIFVLLVFSIPIIFSTPIIESTGEFLREEGLNEHDETKIKLLHHENNEIEEKNMDEYLYGVVSAEMPASYEIEALKAQAIVARTYTLYKMKNGSKHENATICDDSNCCQAWISKENRMARWDDNVKNIYWNKIEDAVNSTSKKYITYNGEVINAFFHGNSGGKTELAINVWGGDLPYLKSVETSGEEAYSAYSSQAVFSKDELVVKMNSVYKDFEIDWKKVDCIKIEGYTDGNRVLNILIGNKKISGNEARKIFGLKSANFNVKVLNDTVEFDVIGYGHGVGLSQSGSDVLAKNGKKYEEIIKYYFKDVEITE